MIEQYWMIKLFIDDKEVYCYRRTLVPAEGDLIETEDEENNVYLVIKRRWQIPRTDTVILYVIKA